MFGKEAVIYSIDFDAMEYIEKYGLDKIPHFFLVSPENKILLSSSFGADSEKNILNILFGGLVKEVRDYGNEINN